MKPMGQRPVRFPGKTDCHPPRGYVNWWEKEMNQPSKKRARQQARKALDELHQMDQELNK